MQLIEIFLPGSLLLAKFLLKLFIDKDVSLKDFISAILSLPVDMIFLSASLFAGAVISAAGGKVVTHEGLVKFIVSLIVAMLVIVVWKRSQKFFDQDKFMLMLISSVFGYAVSVGMLMWAVGGLSPGSGA